VENAHAWALLETNGLKLTPRRVALSGIADKVSVIRDFLGTALVGGVSWIAGREPVKWLAGVIS
jgi:hypothetical protein